MSTSTPPPGPSSRRDVPAPEPLPDDPALLKQMILELLATLHTKDLELEGVRQRLDALLRRLYGPRSERFDPNQPVLFPEMAEPTNEEAKPTEDTSADAAPARRGKPHGRRQLPDHLPREARHYELTPPERVCPACGTVRIDIGVDASEQLDYKPASLIVIEHIVHKYACPCCSKPRATVPVAAPVGAAVPGDTRPGEAAVPQATPLPPSTATASEALSIASVSPDDTTLSPVSPLRPGVVIAAPRPAPPIAKGMPGPGLLAHLIVSKYVEHLPLHRLERSYERHGLFLSRSTTCDWLAACATVLRPLYERMIVVVLQSHALHTDDTTIKNQSPPPACTDLGRMWAYLGDAAHPLNVFDFTPNRKRDGPQAFLKDFQGYLHADAFSGYDALYLPLTSAGVARIIEVACNAHARRKFYEARGSDATRSHQALAYYGQLYEIERRAKELKLDDHGRQALRRDLALPILAQLHDWLEAQRLEVLPKSPMGEAIGYALRNWTALKRYTEAGFLAIDNNVAEREMKRIAIGRKNWLFVGSVQGGHTAAVHMSFTSTCHRLGIEPWTYLRDVLTRLPNLPPEQIDDLLPHRWLAARRAAESASTS